MVIKKMIKVPSLRINNIKRTLPDKRAFFLSSGKTKGSMALEGSMILPVFLFFMMTVLLSLEAVRFQSNMMEALHQIGNKSAFEEYQVKYAGKEKKNVQNQIKEYMNNQLYPYICIAGEEGGVLYRDLSTVEINGQVELLAEYRMKPFIRWLPIGDIRFRDRFFGHSWTGYCGSEYDTARFKEVYVYITKTGSRYHKSYDCAYLKVRIQTVSFEQISSFRNSSGSKYYPCLRCSPAKGGIVYITADGGSYHSQSNCSSLKRTIYMIPLSEAGTYSPCSKCGG